MLITSSVWNQALSGGPTQRTKLTLKTRRAPLRSDFHAVITSLSFFEWNTRETMPRSPFSTIFCRISITVLPFHRKTIVSRHFEPTTTPSNLHRQLLYRLTRRGV